MYLIWQNIGLQIIISSYGGKYSKLSIKAKQLIMDYKWEDLNQESKNKLYCYLFPSKEECLEPFARDLGVNIEDLKEIGELCSPPDYAKETFNHPPLKQKIENEQSTSKD